MTQRDGRRRDGNSGRPTVDRKGRATAIALAQAGGDVALRARSEDDLRRVTQEIAETTGRRALSLPLDLADEEVLLAAAAAATIAFGSTSWSTRPGPTFQGRWKS